MELWKQSAFLLMLSTFFTSFGVSQLAPILPLYFHSMGVETSEELSLWSGLATGVTFIVVCLVAPFWGRLADRKGRKITLIRSSLGMALCNLAIAFMWTPEGVVVCRLAQGLVSGFYTASVTLIASETPQEHTGWALGLLTTGQMAGSLVGPFVGGYLADTIGIRGDFILVSCMMLIAFIISSVFVKEKFVPKANKEKQSFKAMKAQIPDFKGVMAIYIATFIFALCATSLQPIVSVYIKDMLPPDATNIAFVSGAVFSCVGVAQLMSSTWLGRLVDKVGPRKVLLVCLVYVGLMNIPQAYTDSVYSLGLLRFLQGFGMGGLLPALNTFLSAKTPKHLTGQVFSYNQSFLFLGYFFGAIGGSVLMASMGFTALFWVAGLLYIVTALWIFYQVK